MRGFDAVKAVGMAVLALALNFLIAFLAVSAYAQFVAPGRSQAFYNAAAPQIAGWSAPVCGALLLLWGAYVFSRRRPQRNAWRFSGLMWLAYVIVDIGSGAAAGDASAMVSPQMAVSMGLALAGALGGAALATRRAAFTQPAET